MTPRAGAIFDAGRCGSSSPSFGRPIAHLAHFELTCVREPGCLGAAGRASLVAPCRVRGEAGRQIQRVVCMLGRRSYARHLAREGAMNRTLPDDP